MEDAGLVRHQVSDGSALNNPPALHDENPVGIHQRVQPVGNRNDGAVEELALDDLLVELFV